MFLFLQVSESDPTTVRQLLTETTNPGGNNLEHCVLH